jgi:hypothetical protein
MTEAAVRFFPDTNIIVALIMREQRYWSSNVLFSDQIDKNRLPCTILPTIEAEFHSNLDKTIDFADELLVAFTQALNARKLYQTDQSKQLKMGREDVSKVERSFTKVYRGIDSVTDLNIRRRKLVAYDLMEALIMDSWSQTLKESREVSLDEFTDSLKAAISEGRRTLEDGFLGLKRKLNHVDCDWTRDSTIEADIRRFVHDPTDVPHVSMAIGYLRKHDAPAIYVTNDNEILKASERLQNKFSVVVTRPAFAYAYSLGTPKKASVI